MLDKLQWKSFSEVDLKDCFFDSLRADYPGFDAWYAKKADKNEKALVFINNTGVHAFLYLKEENEAIETADGIIPSCPRIKIGTLKLDDTIGGQRLGEGIIGVALWRWQETKRQQIYVTIFEKHKNLVEMFQKFGFTQWGVKDNGELILGRDRTQIDYSNAYTAFPFISPNTKKAGILPINDYFHDRLFPYSESYYTASDVEETTAGNGITKVYIGTPYSTTHYSEGDIVGIYRKYNGVGAKGNRSAITSFCVITKVTVVKRNYRAVMSYETFLKDAGNKTVFTKEELDALYHNSNVVMIEMTYNGFFDKKHNVTYNQLNNQGLFHAHPYKIVYSMEQIEKIIGLGGKDVGNIIVSET